MMEYTFHSLLGWDRFTRVLNSQTAAAGLSVSYILKDFFSSNFIADTMNWFLDSM